MSNFSQKMRSASVARLTRLAAVVLAGGFAASLSLAVAPAAQAETYVPISGAGSSWSANAIDQWRRNVEQYGMRVNYASTGSSDGRNQFKAGTIDFASSEIPYGLKDGGVIDTPPSRSFAYMPIVAGGTAFMYNLRIGGQLVTNLRLSGDVLTKIFTGDITMWNDPAIAADNPNLSLPARKVVPVVRSDGSGSTAQFTTWMASEHQSLWDNYCKAAGRSTPCGVTSNYPTVAGKGFVAQPNSQGVAGYVAQRANEGTITYVEYSYALKTGYPVAKVLNHAGYYVEPTASNVAVGLLSARINEDKNSDSYLTQELTGVFRSADKRTYPLSSYSYIVVPTSTQSGFTTAKGKTLGAFAYYFLCEGQQQAEVLGYSPLPINLVQAGLDQVRAIPGVAAQTVDLKGCNNPTFSSDGTNTLAKNAPMPGECNKKGVTQCTEGTGGASKTKTAVSKKTTGTTNNSSNSGSGTSTTSGNGTSTTGDGTTTAGDGTDTGDATTSDPTGDVGGDELIGADPTGVGGDGSSTGNIVSPDYGGGPVVCEQDTGICMNVIAEPVTLENSAEAVVPTGAWLAIGAAALAIAAPSLVAFVLRRKNGTRATSGGAR